MDGTVSLSRIGLSVIEALGEIEEAGGEETIRLRSWLVWHCAEGRKFEFLPGVPIRSGI